MNNPEGLAISQADSILQIIANDLEDSRFNCVDSVTNFATQIPAYSGNNLEGHLSKQDTPFDFSCRINSYYDKPLLSLAPPAKLNPSSFI